MPHKSYILLTLTSLCGLLVSIAVWFAGHKLCDQIQQSSLEEAGRAHITKVVNRLDHLLNEITETSSQFASRDAEHKPNDADFEEFAKQLSSHPEIHSIEWMPVIQSAERESFEDEISALAEVPKNLVAFRNGRTIPPPTDEVCTPIRFVSPLNDKTKHHLGLQRYDPAKNAAARQQTALLTRPRFMYPSGRIRYGLYVPISKPTTTLNSTNRPFNSTPFVFVTFNELFHDCVKTDTTRLRISDRTGLRSQLGNSATALTNEPVTPENKPDADSNAAPHTGSDDKSEFTVASSSEKIFAGTQAIGGRLFRFSVSESSTAGFRPTWIPWTGFILCNTIATLLACWLYRRDSRLLVDRATSLKEQNERRLETERRLQGMLDFREHERELIAHDIHDGFVQDVIGAQMYVESVLAGFPTDSAERANVQLISEVLTKAINDARQTIDFLKPRVVDEIGLVAALEASTNDDRKQYGFETTIHDESELPRLPLLAERMLYRMTREAICNARQHSGANQAKVDIHHTDETIVIEISDQGTGFEPATVDRNCFGIAGIQHRADVLKGFAIFKSDESGTVVSIQVPRDLDVPERPDNESLSLMP